MNWFMIFPIAVLILSVVFHEVAHAWVARREGDDTAERLGRITLNPIPHLDPVGSFIVPVALALLNTGFIFGWARPVPINPMNFRTPVWSDIRVSMAGIVVNLGLALVFAIVLSILDRTGGLGGGVTGVLMDVAYYGILINLVLAVFNLIPIPPLDGSHVFAYLLPPSLRGSYRAVGGVGILLLMGLFYLVPGGFGLILKPVYFIMDLLFRLVGLSSYL
jgi:Zn-dependent protease